MMTITPLRHVLRSSKPACPLAWAIPLLTLVVALLGRPESAAASTTYNWDLNGTAAGSGANGTTANWDTVTANWDNTLAGTGAATKWVNDLTLSIAQFSAGSPGDATGSYTVNVVGTIQADVLKFINGTVTLTGSSTPSLQIGTGGLSIMSSINGTTTLDASLGTVAISGTPGWSNSSTQALIVNCGVTTLGNGSTATLSNTSSGGGSETFNGVLSDGGPTGTLTLKVTGAAATTILTAANTYTGATTVSAGVLAISNSSALGTGVSTSTSGVTVSSGALQLSNNISTTTAVPLTLSGTGSASQGALENVSGSNTYSGLITLAASATIGADSGSTLNLTNNNNIIGSTTGLALTLTGGGTGNLSGAWNGGTTSGAGLGSLVKSGIGAWTLSGASTYQGATTVNAGTLSEGAGSLVHVTGKLSQLINGASLGNATSGVPLFLMGATPTLVGAGGPGGTTGINSSVQNAAIVPYFVGESGVATTLTGTATGTPNTFLTYNATTGFRPLNPTDEFTNNATTAGNNIYITTGAASTATTAAINSLVINGNNLTIPTATTLTDTSGALLFVSTNSVTGAGTGTLDFGSAEAMITVNSGKTGTISAIVTGAGGLTPSGAGTLALSNASNSFSGGTTINSGSTLSISSDGNLGAAASGLTFNGGTLLASTSINMGGTRPVTVNAAGGAITPANGVTVAIAGAITGSGNLAFNALSNVTAALALSGNNAGFSGNIGTTNGNATTTHFTLQLNGVEAGGIGAITYGTAATDLTFKLKNDASATFSNTGITPTGTTAAATIDVGFNTNSSSTGQTLALSNFTMTTGLTTTTLTATSSNSDVLGITNLTQLDTSATRTMNLVASTANFAIGTFQVMANKIGLSARRRNLGRHDRQFYGRPDTDRFLRRLDVHGPEQLWRPHYHFRRDADCSKRLGLGLGKCERGGKREFVLCGKR